MCEVSLINQCVFVFPREGGEEEGVEEGRIYILELPLV